MTMPAQKPHRSEQDVGTPPDFLAAVHRRFGFIAVDLAANDTNQVAVDGWFYGPGSSVCVDSLAEVCQWPASRDMLCWLNPPYGNIGAWAKKCAEQGRRGSRILLLVPASVGSTWFNRYVRPYAYVLELTPRLTFVGHDSAYPKDLILCYYAPERLVGREAWAWKPPKPANDNAVDPRQLALPEAAP